MRRPEPHPTRPGQESVWSYPRPPRVEPEGRRVRIELDGTVVADTDRAQRVLETSHPPVYYIPREDVRARLEPNGRSSYCEWKGRAAYLDVRVGDRVLEAVAWSYPEPSAGFGAIAGHVAFYCHAFDRCTVGGEVARPQPGGFYGGWVTDDIVGPFKGGPGSWGW